MSNQRNSTQAIRQPLTPEELAAQKLARWQRGIAFLMCRAALRGRRKRLAALNGAA